MTSSMTFQWQIRETQQGKGLLFTGGPEDPLIKGKNKHKDPDVDQVESRMKNRKMANLAGA